MSMPYTPPPQKPDFTVPLRDPRAAARGLPAIWFLTDGDRVTDPLDAAARLPPDCGVILRDYRHPHRAGLAARLVAVCRRQNRPVLIAGDAALAAAVGADGLHVPRWMAAPEKRDGFLLSFAAHDALELDRANRARADMALVSPVFASGSHPGGRALGLDGLARLAALADMPVYALGGIDRRTIEQLKGVALAGIAGIGALMGEDG